VLTKSVDAQKEAETEAITVFQRQMQAGTITANDEQGRNERCVA
jgi:hypothetical protein